MVVFSSRPGLHLNPLFCVLVLFFEVLVHSYSFEESLLCHRPHFSICKRWDCSEFDEDLPCSHCCQTPESMLRNTFAKVLTDSKLWWTSADSCGTRSRSTTSKNPCDLSKSSKMPGEATTTTDTDTLTQSSKNGLDDDLTIQAAHITEVHNVPMRVLIRPIPSLLDEEKVKSLMDTIQEPSTVDSVPPIDILWVKGRQGGDYYYSFGGCHRYEAYKRLQRETIPCKVFKSTVDDIRIYLGGSMPDLL